MGGLRITYNVHLGLIGKHVPVVDFLLALIELFRYVLRLREALRAKIDGKSAFLKLVGQYAPNFHAEGDVPTNHF